METQEQTTELATVNPPAQSLQTSRALRLATIASLQEKNETLNVANLDPANRQDAIDLLRMETGEAVSIWECNVEQISVTAILVRQAEQFNKNTGEIEGKLRTTFLAVDGKAYASNSAVVARSALTALASMFGDKRFDPPVIVRFSKQPTQSGGKALCAFFDFTGGKDAKRTAGK